MEIDQLNYWVISGILLRSLSIIILVVLVMPIQWRELNRLYKRREAFGGEFWKLALQLLVVVMTTVCCAILPITYSSTLIQSSRSDLANLATLSNNVGLFIQSIGWLLIYKTRYSKKS